MDPAKKTHGKCISERVKEEIYLLVQKNLIFRRSMRMSLKNRKEEWQSARIGEEGQVNIPAKHKGRENRGVNYKFYGQSMLLCERRRGEIKDHCGKKPRE